VIKIKAINESVLKNTVVYAIGDIVPKLLAFIMFPVLTRYMTPAEYGIVNYVNSLTAFLLIFSILSLNTYYLVNYHKCVTAEEQQRLLGGLTVFVFAYNILVVLLFVLAGYLYARYFDNKVPFYPFILVGILANFFNTFSLLPFASFRVKGKAARFAAVNIAKNAVQLTLTVFMVVALHLSAQGVLYSILIANLLFFFYFVVYTSRNAILNFDYGLIRKALAFSLPLVPGALAYLFINFLDRLIIARFLTLNDLGLYGTASTLGFLINIVSTGFYQAFEPHIFRHYHEPSFSYEFQRLRKLLLFVLLVASLAIALYSREFLYYMSGKGFHNAYLYVPFLLLGGVFAGMNLLYSTIITASGRTKVNSFNIIMGCVASIVANLVLVPLIGIWGAALAFCLGFGVILVLAIYRSGYPSIGRREIAVWLLWGLVGYLFVYYFSFTPGGYSIISKAFLLLLFMAAAYGLLGIKIQKKQ
jgi:O-antigen/teichoic acid export membrane protein